MRKDNELLLYASKLQGKRTNHVFHLLMSILTAGIWLPVWLLFTISNALERARLERKIKNEG